MLFQEKEEGRKRRIKPEKKKNGRAERRERGYDSQDEDDGRRRKI